MILTVSLTYTFFTDTTRNPRPGEEDGKGTLVQSKTHVKVGFCGSLNVAFSPKSLPHSEAPLTWLLHDTQNTSYSQVNCTNGFVPCWTPLMRRDETLCAFLCFLHRVEQAPYASGGYFTARSRRLFLGWLRNFIFVPKWIRNHRYRWPDSLRTEGRGLLSSSWHVVYQWSDLKNSTLKKLYYLSISQFTLWSNKLLKIAPCDSSVVTLIQSHLSEPLSCFACDYLCPTISIR